MIKLLSSILLASVAATSLLAQTSVPRQEDWNEARHKVTLQNGQELSYVHFGASEGVPVVLLHGYTDNSRSWSLIGPWLSDRPVYALDLRGHGQSAAPICCYGLDNLASDVGAFVDVMGLGSVDLVGHSLGSMTAAVLAATQPEKVNRLVLVSSALKMPKGASDWLWENVPSLPTPIDPDSQFMLDWYTNPTPVDAEFITRERGESAAVKPWVWQGVLTALTLTDWTDLAPRIQSPTLILWGDQDGFFGETEQNALREGLPKATFEASAGLGHNMFWEQPETYGRRIAAFLNE